MIKAIRPTSAGAVVRVLGATVLLWFAAGPGVPALMAQERPGAEQKPGKGDDKAPLGSPGFYPSPEHPVGWRGDGSGRFPGATPPVHWERAAKSVKGLRAQAAKPKEGGTGKPIADGVIREWLVLGPVQTPEGVKPDADALPDEAQWSPDAEEKVGDLAWRKIATDDAPALDFKAIFGATSPVKAVAYAHAYVYSESAQPFVLRWMIPNESAERVLCNGKKWEGKLDKGWNRLLFRVTCGVTWGWRQDTFASWHLRQVFFGDKSAEYEERNIAWRARLPGWSIAQPVIVGDRLFANGSCRTLYCLDKKDGRVLWARTTTYADVATEDEKKAQPDIFGELEPLLKKLREMDAACGTGEMAGEDAGWKKIALEDSIAKLMTKVDREKYQILAAGEAGICSPVPTSDGRHVCAVYQDLVACFDLDGNPKWVYKYPDMTTKAESHGYHNSPRLIGGKAIAYFQNPLAPKIAALDAETGAVAWTHPPVADKGKGYRYYASMLSMIINNEPVLVTPRELLRVRDGKVLADLGDNDDYVSPTPVVNEGVMFHFAGGRFTGSSLRFVTFPPVLGESAKVEVAKLDIDTAKYPRYFTSDQIASPLYHDGLVYCVNNDGVLSVIDAAKRELVYQKMLDADLYMKHSGCPGRGGCCSSPSLAGRYIYIFGNRGTCLVIEPGREFRQVAKNRMERIAGKTNASWGGAGSGDPESAASCPTFEGGRLYYRALDSLYCIEEKK